MDEMSLVSIILPTYNVEPYLEKCLFSVTRQTYKKIEVIIVIDGATDGSYEIAKRVAEKDQRVRVIWQNNAGSGPARNNGIDHAKSEYIIFVDPDDFVDSNMVQLLMETQAKENVDLILPLCRVCDAAHRNALCQDLHCLRVPACENCRQFHIFILLYGALHAASEISIT